MDLSYPVISKKFHFDRSPELNIADCLHGRWDNQVAINASQLWILHVMCALRKIYNQVIAQSICEVIYQIRHLRFHAPTPLHIISLTERTIGPQITGNRLSDLIDQTSERRPSSSWF